MHTGLYCPTVWDAGLTLTQHWITENVSLEIAMQVTHSAPKTHGIK